MPTSEPVESPRADYINDWGRPGCPSIAAVAAVCRVWVVNAFTQSVTGHITSTLDGDTQTIPDPAKAEAAKTGA